MSVDKRRIDNFIRERGYFTNIPNEIWEMVGLSLITKSVWCYVYSRAPDWNSSRNNVARNLDISVNTVTVHINLLEQANMLNVDRSKEAWSFEILPPDKWITNCSGSDLIQITNCSTSESPIDPVLDHQLIHTKESIINNNKNNDFYENDNYGETENADLKFLQEILDSGAYINKFQKQVIESVMPFVVKGKPLSEKQRAILKPLVKYDNKPNPPVKDLPVSVSSLSEIAEMTRRVREKPRYLAVDLRKMHPWPLGVEKTIAENFCIDRNVSVSQIQELMVELAKFKTLDHRLVESEIFRIIGETCEI